MYRELYGSVEASTSGGIIRRIDDEDEQEEDGDMIPNKRAKTSSSTPTDVLTSETKVPCHVINSPRSVYPVVIGLHYLEL